jgi:hypothetical protein
LMVRNLENRLRSQKHRYKFFVLSILKIYRCELIIHKIH